MREVVAAMVVAYALQSLAGRVVTPLLATRRGRSCAQWLWWSSYLPWAKLGARSLSAQRTEVLVGIAAVPRAVPEGFLQNCGEMSKERASNPALQNASVALGWTTA